MDSTTAAVRALYERFPYPHGGPELRVGFDAAMVLGLTALQRPPSSSTMNVLDAGCGRGVGLIGAASVQPEVAFVGVDVSRVSLADGRATAAALGLENVEFHEVDLTTLDGLPVPAGGFDLIHSSGVIHHMEDPAVALRRLGGVLAPHGVIVLMVYAKLGREPYARVTRAIDAVVSVGLPVSERLGPARALVTGLAALNPAFAEAAATSEVEFVDRYLHIQECAFDVRQLYKLVADAGLEVLRWCNTDAWSVDQVPAGLIREQARAAAPADRDTLIEALTGPRVFEVYLVKSGNVLRPPLSGDAAAAARFAVSSEGNFELTTRSVPGQVRHESLRFRKASGVVIELQGVLGLAGLCLQNQVGPFTGHEFYQAILAQGASAREVGFALAELLRLGLIVRPSQ